ncbi:MAG: hypothetical protein RLZZ455_1155 [Candidatus Parcubacteria bacterium]
MFRKWYFLLFGLLDLIALSIAFFASLHVLSIYFSYFTVLSNILITFIFLSFGLQKKTTALVHMLFAPAVLYMTITGIVFWTILRNNHLQTVPWINIVLHGIMPIAAVTAWIVFTEKRTIPLRITILWLLFPVFFVCYTLIRGPFAHWYPYPFLNPETTGGYMKVAISSILILAGGWLLSLSMLWVQEKRVRKTR